MKTRNIRRNPTIEQYEELYRRTVAFETAKLSKSNKRNEHTAVHWLRRILQWCMRLMGFKSAATSDVTDDQLQALLEEYNL